MSRTAEQTAFDKALEKTAPELDAIAAEELAQAQEALEDSQRNDEW